MNSRQSESKSCSRQCSNDSGVLFGKAPHPPYTKLLQKPEEGGLAPATIEIGGVACMISGFHHKAFQCSFWTVQFDNSKKPVTRITRITILCSFGLFWLFGLWWIWFFGFWVLVLRVMDFGFSGYGHWVSGLWIWLFGFIGHRDLVIRVIWVFGFGYSGYLGYSDFRDLVFRVYGAHKLEKAEKPK